MTRQGIILCALTVLFSGLFGPALQASDTERELRDAVASMNSWLGADATARQWRQFLSLNILDSQSALGHRADANALSDVYAKFASNADGLDHPVFLRVRNGIDAHLDQLARNQLDIQYAAEIAKNEFVDASADDLEAMRNNALFNVKMLRRYYKFRLKSRERALLFYEFQPEATVKFLETMELETRPERSKDVINEEIESIKERIAVIDEQVKRLNDQRDKIREWIENPTKNRLPAGVDRPGPDDDDGPILESPEEADDLIEQTNTSSDKARQEEMDQIESGRVVLLDRKQELENQVKQLQQEIKELAESEKERVKRFRSTLNEFNRFLDGFGKVNASRNDAYFGSAITSLDRLKAAFIAGASPSTKRNFDRNMVKFQELYPQLRFNNDRRSAAEIGVLTGWMESAGQAQDLVSAVRAQHSLPNMYLEFSNYLINEFARQDVNEDQKVEEQILGRLIRGKAKVIGVVSVDLTPDPYQVKASIDLTGSIASDTFTRSGKLTAFAGANGQFNVRRDLFANVGGLFACDIYGDMQLDSYFKCITSNLRLVQKIALKQYQKSKLQSEAISRERTKEKLFPQFEEQTDEALAGAFERFEEINQRQTDAGKMMPQLYMFSTNDRVVTVGHHSTQNDLAAPNKPEFFSGVSSDVQLKLHESMISNYISPILADQRLTNVEIAAKVAELTGRPVEPKSGDDDDNFTVFFSEARPIQIEFEDNQIAVTIIGDDFARAGKRIKSGLVIRLAFKFVRVGDKIKIEPASNVSVDLKNPEQRNIGTVPFANFLEGRLTDVLAEAKDRDFELPLNLIPTDELGEQVKSVADQLHLSQLRMQDGWLYVGWKYQPKGSYFSGMVDLPAISYPVLEVAPSLDASASLDDELDISEQLEDSQDTTAAQ